MFHYVVVNRNSVVSRTSDVATARQSVVTAEGRQQTAATSQASDETPARCGRASPDLETHESSRTISDDVVDCADVEGCQETTLERPEKPPTGCSAVESRTVSAREHTTTTTTDDDDSCLSISTSVTVVISRRSAASNSSASANDQAPTDDSDTKAQQTANQLVLSATIPAKVVPSLPPKQPEAETPTGEGATVSGGGVSQKVTENERSGGGRDLSTPSHVTCDVTRASSGSSRSKRKSLESVIKSLQLTPVVVARSRPEVLVRPMQAVRPNLFPVSTLSVPPLNIGLNTPCSQPEVIDLRRPKRPAPSGSCVSPAVMPGRRRPKSLSPLHAAPPAVDLSYHGDKRRRMNSGNDLGPFPTSGRFGPYFPPPSAGFCTPAFAAAAARYRACLAAGSRPEVPRLPVYYSSLQQRMASDDYDAPLELTTKTSRDRK